MDGHEVLEDEFKQRCKHSEYQFGAEANARHTEGHVESYFFSLTSLQPISKLRSLKHMPKFSVVNLSYLSSVHCQQIAVV